jgi:hypothetical protein
LPDCGLEVAVQRCGDLVPDLCAALDQPAATPHESPQHPHPVVTDPDRGDRPAASRSARTLASTLSVFTRVADRAHLLGVREHHLGDLRLEEPGDRQRIPSRLHHDQVGRREALREQLKQLRRSGQPTGGARAGGVSDRDLTMVAMHV